MADTTKPKLLIVYPNQFGYHTDSFKYCENLRETFDISYFCFDQDLSKVDIDGINIFYNPYKINKIARLARFYNNIINYTNNSPVDILFVIQFKFCFILGLFARARIKIIDYRTGDLSPNLLIRHLKNRIMWFDSLFYTHLCAISEGLRDILNLRKTKTFILPIGGDTLSTEKHSYEEMDLLYVGSFNGRNIHDTITGFATFLEKYKESSLSISYTIVGFGKDDDVNKIKTAIDKLKLGKKITILDRVKYTDLNQYFDRCNIGVAYIPKKPYYEHQPATKTFEYINSGLFTIATSTFENSKIINAHNGVLCDDSPESFAHSIETVYHKRGKINENEIRDSLKQFRWDNLIHSIFRPYLINLLK